MNVVAKSTNLSPFLKAVSAAVPNALSPSRPTSKVDKAKFLVVQPVIGNTGQTLHEKIFSGPVSVRTGIAVPAQIIQKRLAHTDIRYPDFTECRKSSCQDPTGKHKDDDYGRKSFSYMMFGGTVMVGTYAVKKIATAAASSMWPAANLVAMAKIEVNITSIPEGKNAVFKWRGKPVFVRHRTPAEIAREESVNMSELRDPQPDSDRVKFKEWLVVIGVCTHLGCVPIANAGAYGGYYCPCHGSHYDASGRIRKGPAPSNLEIPEHVFTDEGTLIIG